MSTFTRPVDHPNAPERPSPERHLLLLIVAAILAVGALVAPSRDSLSYWAAGQQLVHHANPYSAVEVSKLEDRAGFRGRPGDSIIMRNPPYALLLVIPLGYVGSGPAGVLWSLLLLLCFVCSVDMIHILHGRPKNHLHFIGYFFGPAIACLLGGQSAILALLGLVLFLRLHTNHPFLSGAALWLCAMKPHLFVPFGTVLLLWIFINRSYQILSGVAITMGVSIAVTFLLDHSIWHQYLQLMRASGIDNEFIPCWSIALRFWISPSAMWLQFVLPVSGCIWAILYFWAQRDVWDWVDQGSLLVLVSVFVAPYAWFIDQSILVSPLLHGVYCTTSRLKIALLALASSLVVLQVFASTPIHSVLYLWTAPAWLAWYLWARQKNGVAPGSDRRPNFVS